MLNLIYQYLYNEYIQYQIYKRINDIGINPDAEYIPVDDQILEYTDNGILDNERRINIYYKGTIIHGDNLKFDLYFEVKFEEENNNLRNLEEKAEKQLIMVKSFNVSLCLADVECKEGDENFGRQKIETVHKIEYKKEEKTIIQDNNENEEEEKKEEEKKGRAIYL